ncbi:ABC transporter permease [Actinomadura darangshiensis]|uniref:ABC transporter permease n=1 Tax=Actinomadura darangshiensis TaxID=705336 RepID=A0A4R5AEU1_9ACTN|nr:ABC transporter permease [Actinomadura darangshiensis]TDD68432.1 ABC transporter permease [Actinomadura darangshiensis]
MTAASGAPAGLDAGLDDAGLVEPGHGGGLGEVFRRRYLLRLIVRRELRARYQGSLLGLGWSYVRPAAHFAVFYFVAGVFLRMSDRVEHFPIFMFSALVLVSFFNETLINTTHSVLGNAPLVRKVYLPRELFPVASLLVSCVHLLPGLAIVLTVASVWGWTPSAAAIGSALLGFALVATLGIALGLICSALHVFYRDTDKVVDIATLFVTWSVPMIYPWTVVRDTAPGWALDAYLANPMAVGVLLFERAFWWPTTDGASAFPADLTRDGFVLLAMAVLLLGVGQFVFARLQRRFAEEL